MHKIYVQKGEEVNLSYEERLVLIKPLYRLPDGNDYSKPTITEHLKTYHSMSEPFIDNALYFNQEKDDLTGLTGQ